MVRLFVALRPLPVIRRQLLAATGEISRARWQDDDQLHLTLRFVGEVDRPTAEDLAAALGQVAAPPPTITLASVGRFDKRGRTDTLWAGVAQHAALTHLHRKVDQACIRVGLPPDTRAYHPHITLARLPRGAGAGAGAEPEVLRWLIDHAALTSAPFPLPHIVLYQSELGRDGATYEPVARWPLGEY